MAEQHVLIVPEGWNRPEGTRPSCSCGEVMPQWLKTSPRGWHGAHQAHAREVAAKRGTGADLPSEGHWEYRLAHPTNPRRFWKRSTDLSVIEDALEGEVAIASEYAEGRIQRRWVSEWEDLAPRST